MNEITSKRIIVSLSGFLILLLCLFFTFSIVINADDGVNPSVVLKPAPSVVEIKAPQKDYYFEIPPSGYVGGVVSDIEKIEPVKPIVLDFSTLQVIALKDAEALLNDEKLGEDAELLLDMYQKLARAKKISEVVNKEDLAKTLEKYEEFEKITPDDLTVFNIFDVWFENSSALRHNEDPKVFVTLCLEIGEMPFDYFTLVQYDGDSWNIIEPAKIVPIENGLYNISLQKMAPIAIIGLTPERYEEINNPYYGETLPVVTTSFASVIAVEACGIFFLVRKRNKLLAGVPIFGVPIAWSTIIVVIAEIAITTILSMLLVNLLIENHRKKKNNLND